MGNTCAMPMIYMLNKHYSSHAADILRTVLSQYVDDGFSLTVEDPRTGIVDPRPAQGILVDAATYAQGIHEIDIPLAKVQYYTNGLHKTIYLPTKQKRVDHLGNFWHTDTPAERLALLQNAEEVHTHNQARYLGCTVNFSGTGARIPYNARDIRRDTQQELELVRLPPAAAMMLIDSKVPTRWYAVASVYKPNKEQHHRNDALLLRMYKQLTGLSRYAKTAAIWAPQRDSGLGMGRAAARHAVAVQREWIRHHSACKEYYQDGLREYLAEMHLRLGGCPAVLLPRQRETTAGPHVWDCLQHVVTHVDLPMWLPGECAQQSHVLLRHRDNDPMAPPVEKLWSTKYGQVRAVLIPKGVFAMTIKMNVHHLEDLVSEDRGWARHKYGMEAKGAPPYLVKIFSSWYNKHSNELFRLREKHPPEWQEAPRRWPALHILPRTSMTVIGGREAKQEKTKTIIQGSLHLQVDEEYLSNRPSDKPLCVPMCHKGNRGPYLDLRVYKSLVYFFQV